MNLFRNVRGAFDKTELKTQIDAVWVKDTTRTIDYAQDAEASQGRTEAFTCITQGN